MIGHRHLVAVLIVVSTLGSASDVFAQRAFLDIPGIDGGLGRRRVCRSDRRPVDPADRSGDVAQVDRVRHVGGEADRHRRARRCGRGRDRPGRLRDDAHRCCATLPTSRFKLYEIRLTNVRITGVQATTGASDTSETVTLLPQEVTLTYFTSEPRPGGSGPSVSQSFSCQ